ncbi:MAG: hypothetical protein QXU98_05160 [Candidatus Parvarchaeota archaeon]
MTEKNEFENDGIRTTTEIPEGIRRGAKRGLAQKMIDALINNDAPVVYKVLETRGQMSGLQYQLKNLIAKNEIPAIASSRTNVVIDGEELHYVVFVEKK